MNNDITILEGNDTYGLDSFQTLYHTENEKREVILLSKPCNNFIHGMIGIKSSLSKSLDAEFKDLWKTMYERKLEESDFSFSDYCYIKSNSFFGIFEMIKKEEIDQFKNNLEKFNKSINEYETEECLDISGTQKIIVFSNDEKHFISISLSYNNSWYYINSGYINNDGIKVMLKPSCEFNSFNEFVKSFDLKTEMAVTENIPELNISLYKEKKVSLREMLDILKSIGAKVSLDVDKFVDVIECVSSENSNIISKFLNSFNVPFKALSKLKYIKKFFKYNSLSYFDILNILNSEYMNSNLCVDGYLISGLIDNICCSNTDSDDVKTEVKSSSILM